MARNSLTPFRSGSLLGGEFDDIFSLHRDMNRLFDQMMGGASGRTVQSSILNAQMNVSESDGELCIEVELPGVAEPDIDVSLNDDVLTIRGEKKFEKKDESESFHFMERSYGTFQRSVRLPFPADPEKVTARFQNGVLTVTLPKTEAETKTRRIQVQGGGRQVTDQRTGQQDQQIDQAQGDRAGEGGKQAKG